MDLGLKGKVVIITGASKGLGAAFAEAFAAEGCKVVITARSKDELGRLASKLEQNGTQALAVAGDITNSADVHNLVNQAVERFGTVHILVNNAGGVEGFTPFEELAKEDWVRVFNLNLFSAIELSGLVLPYMKKQHWGRIINISSESGIQPDPVMPHYNAAKAALNNLTKSLSKAYAQDGILVNTVSPAFIKTPLVDQVMAEQARIQGVTQSQAEEAFLRQNRPHIELKRAGLPEEVASAVVFMASEQASFITGTNLRVDGGSVASV
ncbi:glucose 1-dehydrogenase [Ktedonosporobacter rubrisoli]|uniref:Glucose 1-dehydrogenase n=1 Tax=Ktedonosporobacter rubrisoli TaxID=2509675 RepID=A0A4P6JMZ5_KTERU|nr:glucose 1-dehydrogenase [Ktedonosporobacter rubrisoli]QBD76440.1 glucose 1-dehydrogenase [Ktedonosporobacter rubrisoli]